jgi:small-conductance mechanosensitive channel
MLTLKTKNREIVDLFNGLQSVQDLQGVKFGLVVSKNVRIIQQELSDIEEASKPSKEFIELSKKVNSLNDEKEKIEELEKENEKIITSRRNQLEEVESLLEEIIEIQLHSVKEDILPENITAAQITAIDKLIE